MNIIIKYFFAWFGMMILAIINGGIRDSIYKVHVGALTAHQISTVTLLILFAIYIWILTTKIPMKTSNTSWIVGILWFFMTLVFEFGMGLFIQNESLEKLFYAYNILEGQVWIFVPVFVLVAPILFYTFQRKAN